MTLKAAATTAAAAEAMWRSSRNLRLRGAVWGVEREGGGVKGYQVRNLCMGPSIT